MPVVMNVVGARPQFVKAAPVSRALADAGIHEILVHTGQHYDTLMSERIMLDVGLREPDLDLGVGSASHGLQTARMLERLEGVILDRSPDAVVAYGDTNSTVATALAATKLGVPTAHVEAGLRSFNRSMPEELNRVATDHLSDLLLAPTQTAMQHLASEGLATRSVLTGDVMVDALQSVQLDTVPLPDWASGEYYCATLHRAENTDDPRRLSLWMEALGSLDDPVHLLAHPRLQERLQRMGRSASGSLTIHPPLSYVQMLAVMSNSRAIFTDSGGLQKEAFILRVPCVTLRGETEWPETLKGGWNVLASDEEPELQHLVSRRPDDIASAPFGDGHAAESIVTALSSLTDR